MKTILSLACMLCIFAASAQPRIPVTIRSATVFLNGAELASSAKVSLPSGESDVLFTNVAGNVNQQSLTIGAETGVVVQSATFQTNYLADSALSPRVTVLRDSIETLERMRAPLDDRKAVIDEQLSVIRENRKISGSNTGVSVAELQKMIDLTATRTEKLLAAQRVVERESEQVESKLSRLRAQVEEEQKRRYTPGGSLLVKFFAKESTTTNIKMTYVVPNAGWTPAYDLRAEKVGEPVHLFYKANVYQNSGVKWNDVRITLSTGNPNEGAEAPVMQPYYLALSHVVSSTQSWNAPIIDPENPGGRMTKTAEQIDKAPTRNTADIAALSTQTYQSGYGNGLSIGGSRNSGTRYVVDGVQLPPGATSYTSVNQYTSVDASGISTTFDIDLPYSIPPDGKTHTVAVKTYELPATYRHYAVPRLDRDAFLQAQITHWEDLNLLPAQTSIFFEGTYVGQGYIDMRNVHDTLNLSLGRDKKIIVKRERDKNFHSKKTIGTNERQENAWTISIRNTRREPVNLVLADEFPVSNDKDVVIEEPTADGATVEESTGAAKWNLAMKPMEEKTLRLSYIVRYPKGQMLAGL